MGKSYFCKPQIDITGQRFARLTVIKYLQPEERRSKNFSWLCKCDCGKEVHSNYTKLKNGDIKSCGCLKTERIRMVKRKYKYVNKRLYAIYKQMLDRIDNPSSREYHNYGGRGIKVCDEWRDFDNFAEWALSSGYDPNAKRGECTLDRRNVDGNYEPNNCEWVDNQTQQNNRRDCIYITYNGKTQTMAQWSRELNIPHKYLNWRMVRCKTIKRTLEDCIREYYGNLNIVTKGCESTPILI